MQQKFPKPEAKNDPNKIDHHRDNHRLVPQKQMGSRL